MIYITGDTHASFNRFAVARFPEQSGMTRDDFVIICGDFGGIWDRDSSSPTEEYWLNWLSRKPFTLLFADGNHENFDRLKRFPVVKFHGGKAHKIRDNIYHLMRGYVFDLQGKTFFTFGGASSHDISDGILDEKDYPSFQALMRDFRARRGMGQMVRVNHVSWWKDELPEKREMDRGLENLRKAGFKVDFVVTHCLPQSAQSSLGFFGSDRLTRYFESLVSDHGLEFGRWYCGHYHIEDRALDKYVVKYGNMERIV